MVLFPSGLDIREALVLKPDQFHNSCRYYFDDRKKLRRVDIRF